MINIIAFSAGRSDIDRWLPFIKDISLERDIVMKFILNSAHFDRNFGESYKIFKKTLSNFRFKKYKKKQSIIQNLFEDSKEFENLIKKKKYDFIILLGDRFEILNIAYLATIYNIPIIHLYGGAITTGAIDNQIRNAVTKLSHFHLVACDLYKKRLIKMGENKGNIKVIGVPSLKEILTHKNKFNKNEIEKKIGIKFKKNIAIITVHPVTLFPNESLKMLDNIFKVIEIFDLTCVFTYPNKDQGHMSIIKKIKNFCDRNKNKFVFIKVLELDLFSSLLNNANIMIGNSSCGIVESSSFKLPTINIGNRQNGKLIPKNVINCQPNYTSILKSVKKCLDKKHIKKISKYDNPYEMKKPLNFQKILTRLKNNKSLLIK